MAVRHKKLQEWLEAGILSEEQAATIHTYEQERKQGRFGRGLIGLSLFAILVGIVSIIAANWAAIPGALKIAVHAGLNLAASAGAIYADRRGKALLREQMTLLFFGLTLTLIILVGQVFQMTGELSDALIFWMVITAPFVLLLGNSYMTAVPFIGALLVTIWTALFQKLAPMPDRYQECFIIGAGALLPLAFMADGAMHRLRRLRPAFADVSLRTGLVLSALGASGALAFWGNGWHGQHWAQSDMLAILGLGLAGLAAHALLHQGYRHNELMKYGAIYALAGLIATMLPLIVGGDQGAALPAILFIAYWIFIGWIAQVTGHMRLISLAIFVIAARIFALYVELFGSLMDTGFGLITGGVVMLALLFVARRLNRFIRTQEAA